MLSTVLRNDLRMLLLVFGLPAALASASSAQSSSASA